MAEKRKATFVMLLRYRGKRHKIELFPANQWKPEVFGNRYLGQAWLNARFRLRVDGRWHGREDGSPVALTRHEFRDLLFRSIRKSLIRAGRIAQEQEEKK